MCYSAAVQWGQAKELLCSNPIICQEDEKFQQSVYVNHKREEFIYLLDVMNAVCDNVTVNKPTFIVLKKVFALITLHLFFQWSHVELEQWI